MLAALALGVPVLITTCTALSAMQERGARLNYKRKLGQGALLICGAAD